MCYGKHSILVFLCFLTFTYNCLKVIPERCAITYINRTYACNESLNVRRTSRGGAYVINFGIVLKLTIGNNVSVHVIFYEYLHNEYKPSFVEVHVKACDLVHHDAYLGSIIRNAGLHECPILAGTKVSLKNVSLNCDIPSVWPFEKGKGEVTVTDDVNQVVIAKGEIMLTFKQK